MTVRLVAFTVLGALAGFAYNRLIGCRTGGCIIAANPYISTLYGALAGLLVSGAWR